MRLMFDCAIAVMLPIAMESSARSASICCQSCARPSSPFTSSRTAIANAASLGAEPITSVIAVGAPW